MSVDSKILRKLKKLLTLSASSNEYEAALALKKAQALMTEHNLTVMDVKEDGSGAYVQDQKVSGLTKRCQKWEASLGFHIAESFDGTGIRTRTNDGWYLTFVATRTDLEIIVDLYLRLRSKVKRMSNDYVQSVRSTRPELPAKTLHNNYRWGMVSTIRERLQRLKENTTPQTTMNQHGYTGMDLMVVKNKAVTQRVTKLFPKIKKGAKTKLTYAPEAYEQGKKDGNNVNLYRSLNGQFSNAVTPN